MKNEKKEVKENIYIQIPSQALKTWRHFDRFDVQLYDKFCLVQRYGLNYLDSLEAKKTI